jgi:hypothetical protein
VTLSWAVTTTATVFDPKFNAIGLLALPEATEEPFTFTVAVVSTTVGVTVIKVVLLLRLTV